MMRHWGLRLAILGCLASPIPAAASVGFQLATFAGSDNQPVELGIWYPSDSPTGGAPDALVHQAVARDGRIAGDHLPLIIISHGSGGWLGAHADTALALAEAGYVVAAPTHSADNYKDRSGYGTLKVIAGRPREIKLAIDFLVGTWTGGDRIDSARVGIFGFSAGGYTALIALGGVPDVRRFTVWCRESSGKPECRRPTERRVSVDVPSADVWTHDARIKAAVVADPGIGFLFDTTALAWVSAPVQLWNASDDEVVSTGSTEVVRASLPHPPEYHLVKGGGHYIYLAPCDFDVAYCKDKPGFDRARFHRELNAAMIHFFDKGLGRR